MLQNYLKLALRNIFRQKFYSGVAVFGLALGITACLFIYIFVRHEWTFDQFHPNAHRIYRVLQHEKESTRPAHTFAETPIPLAATLQAAMPDIASSCRVFASPTLVRQGETTFSERVHLADASMLEMFRFPLRFGDGKTALSRPENLVITVSMAEKLFGTSFVIGRRLSIQLRDAMKEFVVTGVAEDIPGNSSIRFSLLINYDNAKEIFRTPALTAWGIILNETFVLLPDHLAGKTIAEQMTRVVKPMYQQAFDGDIVDLRLQNIRDIHFDRSVEGGSEAKGNALVTYILAGVAIVILLIACANFMMISLGRSVRRSNEVGVRKVFGAYSRQIQMQFVIEACLISTVALLLGIGFAELGLPAFVSLTTFPLALQFDTITVLFFLFLLLFISIVAGAYPAFVLSLLQPTDILKGAIRLTRGHGLQRSLIIAQFAISVILITGTVVMVRQLGYIQSKNPGFDKEQVLVINTGLRPRESAAIYERFRVLANQLPGVMNVAGSSTTVGKPWAKVGFTADNGIYHEFYASTIDEHYIPTMGMSLVAGRNFQVDIPGDRYESLIVNETFVRHFGWNEPLAGKLPGKNFPPHRIIGVVKDFHFQSLHSVIAPAAFVVNPDSIGRGIENIDGGGVRGVNVISIRLAPGSMTSVIAGLDNIWKQVAPGKPFEYSFIDTELQALYRFEQMVSKLTIIAAALAVGIACLGLLSLTALITEQRTKEIGIRKVLGASVGSIIVLISRDFLLLVGVAILIASPCAWWLSNRWLQDFAYRVDVAWWMILFTALMVSLLAFLTVAGQSWRTSRLNPVDTLRHE